MKWLNVYLYEVMMDKQLLSLLSYVIAVCALLLWKCIVSILFKAHYLSLNHHFHPVVFLLLMLKSQLNSCAYMIE